MVWEHYSHVSFSFCCVPSRCHPRKDKTPDLSFIWLKKQAVSRTKKSFFSKVMVPDNTEKIGLFSDIKKLMLLTPVRVVFSLENAQNTVNKSW